MMMARSNQRQSAGGKTRFPVSSRPSSSRTNAYWIILSLILAGSFADDAHAAGETWFKEKMAIMDRSKALPTARRIELLGGLARAGLPDFTRPPDERQLAVAARAVDLLLSIPGHAEFYAKAIEERRTEVEVRNGNRVSQGEEPWWNPYDNFRQFSFGVLSQLPSAETVVILCEFLDDQRDHVPPDQRPKDRNDGRACNLGNAKLAVRALNRLRVRPEPGLTKDAAIREIPLETWRLRYEQARAGTRKLYLPGHREAVDLRVNGR